MHVDPGAGNRPVRRATARITPTKGNQVHGTAVFSTTADGKVRVRAEVDGLPPAKHAYHVHLLGDCSGDDGKTAGTHFNFRGPSKEPPSNIDRITGNLGELEADKRGHATAEAALEHARLDGPYSIIGRSVVIHEKPNDPDSPPIGAAGSRLGCGVIGIDEATDA